MASFDVGSAKQAGYSDKEIQDFLSQNQGVSATNVPHGFGGTKTGGFLGIDNLAKGIAQAIATNPIVDRLTGSPIANAQKSIDNGTKLDAQILAMASKAHGSGDSDKAKKLLAITDIGKGQTAKTVENAITGGTGYATNKQVIGGGLNLAADIAGAGSLFGGGSFAKAVSVEPSLLQAIKEGILLGGAQGAGQALDSNASAGNTAKSALIGAGIGGATPAVLRGTGKAAATVAKGVLGATTGVGSAAVERAFTNPDAVTSALRGKTGVNDILEHAQGGLQSLKNDRQAAYLNQAAKVMGNDAKLDTGKISSSVDSAVKNFKIADGGGPLSAESFANSTIADHAEASKVANLINEVRGWKDTSVGGLDTLKQRINDFNTTSNQGKAIKTSLYNAVNSTLKEQVPGYSKLTKDYAQSSEFLGDVTKALSLDSKKSSKDTAITKLGSALRQNSGFRSDLLGSLDSKAGTDLRSELAGAALNSPPPNPTPSRTAERPLGRGAVTGSITPASIPALVAALLSASPRVVGEGSRALGKASIATKPASRLTQTLIRQQLIKGTNPNR